MTQTINDPIATKAHPRATEDVALVYDDDDELTSMKPATFLARQRAVEITRSDIQRLLDKGTQ